MSIDNNNSDKVMPAARRASDHILMDMYHAVKELKNEVQALNVSMAEEKLKQAHSEEEIQEFKTGMRKIIDRVEQLTVNEAKSSVKFGILTFVATLVFVTAFNLFVDRAQADMVDMQALPPPKTEIFKKREQEFDND
jgi:hypothetical protein